MKVTTWNVNGIRSLPVGMDKIVESLETDVLCIQETKIPRSSLDSQVAFVNGFASFFSFCQKKAGYSGVATYAKLDVAPHASEQEFQEAFDHEGRVLISRHQFKWSGSASEEELYLFNMYSPRFDPDNPERLAYKMRFHRAMEEYARELVEKGAHVLLTGDFNVSCHRIDHCDPDSQPDFDTQEHGLWFRGLLERGFVDLFRHFHPAEEKAFTCWNTKISARENNFGTRLDHFIADKALVDMGFFLECVHLPDVIGSDHCPVQCRIDSEKFTIIAPQKLPDSCTKYMPELRGSQSSLRDFVVNGKKPDPPPPPPKAKKRAPMTLDTFFNPPQKKANSQEAENVENDLSPAPRTEKLRAEWGSIFKGPPPPPVCKGHGEKCILRTVKKKGVNFNRKFWTCAKPAGTKGHPNAQCEHFQWL